KRGFGTTLKEFVQAAEFVLSGGNENVILCERGLRTFETATRFTLDLCGVAWLQEHTNLPIVLDPSHAMGYAEFVLSGGNENVILCERGLRTFETATRFTLDLCGVAWLQEHTNLPIVLDPSHAMGYAYGVPVLSRACV